MATNYPGALDNGTTLPNPSASSATNSPSHASLHANSQDAIKAVETKLGTGVSTPTSNTLLLGTGTGTSAWTQATSAQLAAAISDETGTGKAVFATSPTLITPAVDVINESTPSNGVTVGGVNLKAGVISGVTPGTLAGAALANNAITGILLDVTETTDVQNNVAIAATTWTDLVANKSFTVASTSSIIVIIISVGMQVGGGGVSALGSRAIIDSAGAAITKTLGSGNIAVAATTFGNPFGGAMPIILTGLSAGTHTVKTQIYATVAQNMYLRTATTAYESYRTTVIELKK